MVFKAEVLAAIIQARWVLMLIGMGLIAFHAMILVNVDRMADAAPVPRDSETGQLPSDEEIAFNKERFRVMAVQSSQWNLLAGVWILASAAILPMAPPAIVVIAALVFLGVQIGTAVQEPTTILNGVVVKLAILAGLFTVTRKVLEAETGERAF
ncbi:MAG: hypothetical protein ACOYNP_01415 [Gemmataceae bacterium]|jgi:hypothetical protein|nr:hypothetical protein [Planctomycetota bacterium]